MYSYNEKVGVLLIFGKYKRNAREAAILYATRYPQRHHSCAMFYNIEKNLRNFGEFEKKKRNKPHSSTTADNTLMVVAHLEENPYTSIRAVAETGLSKSSVHKMVKQNRYHPYKMTKVQHLRITDS